MNELANYLRSVRTLTSEQVSKIESQRDRSHMSASDRFDMITHRTPQR